MAKQKTISDNERLLAALSYVWVLFVIPFVFGHNKPFVYRHAKNGMFLFVFELILFVVGWVPLLGWIVGFIGWLFVFVTAVVGIGHAMGGQDYDLPFLSKFIK